MEGLSRSGLTSRNLSAAQLAFANGDQNALRSAHSMSPCPLAPVFSLLNFFFCVTFYPRFLAQTSQSMRPSTNRPTAGLQPRLVVVSDRQVFDIQSQCARFVEALRQSDYIRWESLDTDHVRPGVGHSGSSVEYCYIYCKRRDHPRQRDAVCRLGQLYESGGLPRAFLGSSACPKTYCCFIFLPGAVRFTRS